MPRSFEIHSKKMCTLILEADSVEKVGVYRSKNGVRLGLGREARVEQIGRHGSLITGNLVLHHVTIAHIATRAAAIGFM